VRTLAELSAPGGPEDGDSGGPAAAPAG